MVDDADGYAAYYAAKLWSLLPSIYRTLDPTTEFDPTGATAQPPGPLEELVARIGATAAVLRRSIDRMWEDQSIESCDDWVIPYIAAQLATNLVSSADPREQRIDVAKTIYYRQRKGTIPLLEELAHDVTGWEARVVEMFRRVGRARHGLDPPIGWPQGRVVREQGTPEQSLPVVTGLLGRYTGTPSGGFADLRHAYGARLAGTAFDELSYTADVRLGSGRSRSPDIVHGDGRPGWHNIGTLGVFLWRLQSVPVDQVAPVADATHAGQYTFDPTGRDIRLFAAPLDAYDTAWIPRDEGQLPGPIDGALLKHALTTLYAPVETGGSIQIYEGGEPVTVDQISVHDASKYVIHPARGRFTVPGALPPAGPLLVGYRYGFSSTIGAGGYGRTVASAPAQGGSATVSGGGAASITISSGLVQIEDSLTYSSLSSIPVNGDLVVSALDETRPLVRLASSSSLTFTGAGTSGNTLVLDGLFVSGGDVFLEGTFDQVTLSACTLDPGEWDASTHAAKLAADGWPLRPSRLVIAGTVGSLVIDRCILGPVVVATAPMPPGSVETATLTDSILQDVVPGDHVFALDLTTGTATTLSRCTVLGKAHLYRVEASETIFSDVASVEDCQHGCVRFSAFAPASVLPRQYQSVQLDPGQVLFASTTFGDPHYAALLPSVASDVGTGAENGSEMGAFSAENNPIKERSLLIKYQEYMPIGLAPVLIYVT
jgi:hypothetical protein